VGDYDVRRLKHDAWQFEPGDLLLFAGNGLGSRAIALTTCSAWELLRGRWFSHVGICALYQGQMLLFESTTWCDLPCAIGQRSVQGPQAHPPAQRVEAYRGAVWRLRLDPRRRLNVRESHRLTDFLVEKLGEPYDYAAAALAGTLRLRLLRVFQEDLTRLFCSQYAMAALKDIGRVDQNLNAGAYSPARMARDLQYWGTYQAIGRAGSESLLLEKGGRRPIAAAAQQENSNPKK
jgi:hypothetical protein